MERLQEAGGLLGHLKQQEEAHIKEKVRRKHQEETVGETKPKGSANLEQEQQEGKVSR